MQRRFDYPVELGDAVADYFEQAQLNNNFFTDPYINVSDRLFYNFDEGQSKEQSAITLEAKSRVDAVARKYPQVANEFYNSVRPPPGTKFNLLDRQSVTNIKNNNHALFESLMQSEKFRATWNKITAKISDPQVLQKLQEKLIGAFAFKILSLGYENAVANNNSMPMEDYKKVGTVINTFDVDAMVIREIDLHKGNITNVHVPKLAVSALTNNNEGNINAALQGIAKLLKELPQNYSFHLLGKDVGFQTVNDYLSDYITKVKAEAPDSASKQKFLQELSVIAANHLTTNNLLKSDNATTLASTNKLIKTINNYLEPAQQMRASVGIRAEAAEPNLRGSTAVLMAKTSTLAEQDQKRSQLRSGKITKPRVPERANTESLTSNPAPAAAEPAKPATRPEVQVDKPRPGRK